MVLRCLSSFRGNDNVIVACSLAWHDLPPLGFRERPSVEHLVLEVLKDIVQRCGIERKGRTPPRLKGKDNEEEKGEKNRSVNEGRMDVGQAQRVPFAIIPTSVCRTYAGCDIFNLEAMSRIDLLLFINTSFPLNLLHHAKL